MASQYLRLSIPVLQDRFGTAAVAQAFQEQFPRLTESARRKYAGALGIAETSGHQVSQIELSVDAQTAPGVALLVKRAQGGDRSAFGRLVEAFERTVYAICLRRLGDASEAMDLTQEVFLHAINRLNQLREPERFKSWLMISASRMATNQISRRPALFCMEASTVGRPKRAP